MLIHVTDLCAALGCVVHVMTAAYVAVNSVAAHLAAVSPGPGHLRLYSPMPATACSSTITCKLFTKGVTCAVACQLAVTDTIPWVPFHMICSVTAV